LENVRILGLTLSTPPLVLATPEAKGEVTGEATGEVTAEVASEVIAVLAVLDTPLSRSDLQEALGLKSQAHFRDRYLNPALDGGWIERTQPDAPKSPTQKYRLTQQGQLAAKQ